MPDNITMGFFIVIAVIFVGWFALGTQVNIRKGDTFMRWLQNGLPLVGEKTTMRWMGSSVLELKIAKAKPPMRTFDTLAIFEPRDVIFLWLISYLQGRRDWIIFRAQLNAAPSFELDLLDPKAWTLKGIEQELKKKNWTPVQIDSAKPWVAFANGNTTAAQSILDLATSSEFQWARIAIHRDVPNIEVHVQMPKLSQETARALLTQVRKICEAAK
jgi:hypothetical protein